MKTVNPEGSMMGQKREKRLLRLKQILGDPKNGIEPIIPMSESTWWRGVRAGKFPQPVKYGRFSFWKSEDIEHLVADICDGKLQSSAA